jgi:arabinofuranan 3-O-arabinosyltransferase
VRRGFAQIRRSIGPDLAAFLFFSVVCIAQAAGRVVPDTKIDVVLAPTDFVAKTLGLWEPWTGLGHVPNQSWGYLFPIAPFHVVLDTLQVPAWMAQRVLFALIMTLAFAGLRRLCAEMEIGTTGGRLVAGAGYACSAAMLAQIGVAAAAQPLAHAVVPWVLLQLVKGARTGRARRNGLAAAAWTVVAGGVNVTVVLAVLAIPALYLLTRVGGATRRRLSAWWAIGTVTATLWWTLPLVIVRPLWFDLTGVTETAAITTSTASVLESLRGTANWLNYWRLGGSVTEAGWTQVSSALVIGAMVGLVAAGLVGLSNSSMRDRRFLVLCLLAGVAVQSAAYGGPVGGPLAEPLQRLLDGPLVPFRNVSKFAPLVALPLALGVAHALRGLPDVLG